MAWMTHNVGRNSSRTLGVCPFQDHILIDSLWLSPILSVTNSVSVRNVREFVDSITVVFSIIYQRLSGFFYLNIKSFFSQQFTSFVELGLRLCLKLMPHPLFVIIYCWLWQSKDFRYKIKQCIWTCVTHLTIWYFFSNHAVCIWGGGCCRCFFQ